MITDKHFSVTLTQPMLRNFGKLLGTKSTSFPSIYPRVAYRQTLAKVKHIYFFYNYNCSPLTPTSPEPSNQQANLYPSNFLENLKCSPDYVADMLAMLDTSKSSGPDEISSMLLKSTAYSIAPSLTNLLNNSLAEGALPADWKLARAVPVPKSDFLRNSVSGYRLISIFPTVSKILEYHV